MALIFLGLIIKLLIFVILALAETNTWLSTLAQTGPLDNKASHKGILFIMDFILEGPLKEQIF